jgi:GNAT superfamily N-acetyltransferase
MERWIIEALNRRHDRTTFDCGQPMLTDWLTHRASQFHRKDLARTFVAIQPGDRAVCGYYALSSHQVLFDALPDSEGKGLPSIDVPVVLLGRLGVDRRIQGQGLGSLLLIDALRRVQRLAEELGIRAVEVDAIDQEARNFYLKHGFKPLLDDPAHLFMPLHVIRQLNLPPLV